MTESTCLQMIQIEEKQPQSLLLMVNPQWGLSRQVVSDFGFFGRKKAEEFLARFEDTYFLKSYTIAGDGIRCGRYSTDILCTPASVSRTKPPRAMEERDIFVPRRVLRSYPGDWQIHLVNEETGENTLVCSTPERPSYQLLKETIEKVEGSNSSKPLADRIRREIQFNQDSLSGK